MYNYVLLLRESRLSANSLRVFRRQTPGDRTPLRILISETDLWGSSGFLSWGLPQEGMQPFFLHGNYLVCNGEIYGFRPVQEKLIRKGYSFASDSDCEILLPSL